MKNDFEIKAGLKGAAGSFGSDLSQLAKRCLSRLRIVPPPLRISIDITNRCNFRCPTCSKWLDGSPEPELNFAAWKKILTKIRRTPLLREISVSGGEPFMREDMIDILEEAAANKLKTVVVSNGDLITDAIFTRLIRIPGCTVMLSLNSLQEQIHDASRGVTGSYAAIMRLIDHWHRDPGSLQLSLSTIIMRQNTAELTDIARMTRIKRLNGIIFQALLPTNVHYSFSALKAMPEPGGGWYTDNPYWVSDTDELNRQINRLLRLRRRGYAILNPPSQLKTISRFFTDPESIATLPCIGTMQRLYIDPAGRLRLCYGFPPVGSILADDPLRVWYGGKARRIRQAARTCTKPCRLLNCNL